MFIRLHRPPKKYRNIKINTATTRQRYYFNFSFERYSKTEDGKYINKIGNNLKPEIGRIDSVRFIDNA